MKIVKIWSNDGQRLATALSNGDIIIENLQGGKIARLPGHKGRLNSIDFSFDGKWLASASKNKLLLWNLQNKQPKELEFQNQQKQVLSLSFSRQALLATVSQDGKLVMKTYLTP